MNTRIRYSKLPDSSLVSMRVIKGKEGKEYRAYILNGGKEGVIKDAVNEEIIIDKVFGTSPHKVKIAIKKSLEKLGCKFEKEIRGGT